MSNYPPTSSDYGQVTSPMLHSDITGCSAPPESSDNADTVRDEAQRYQKIIQLGEGTYGVVYLAKDVQLMKNVALKKIRMNTWNEGVPAVALREISALKEVIHPNIVALDDIFVSYRGNLYLVFELADCDLKVLMDKMRSSNRRMDPQLVKWLMCQLLRGMNACHEHRIVHRDLKPQNILINRNSSLRLADFGLARTFAIPLRPYTHEVVTLWYRPPEILLGQESYSPAVDIWSAGCIFAEMMNGVPFFTGDNEIDHIFHIFRALGTPTVVEWPNFVNLPDFSPEFPKFRKRPLSKLVPSLNDLGLDLLESMLQYDPLKRISAADALKHPYFADVAPYEEPFM